MLLLAAVLAGVFLFARRHSHHGDLDLGIWYWHSPFAVSDEDARLLRSAGFTTLYVRTGTFTTDGKRLLLALPEQWQSGDKGFRIVSVFNFDPGLLTHFDAFGVDRMAGDMAPRIAAALDGARKRGIHPAGVQLDIDCPTRLLPKYAELLGRLKPMLAKDFSGTWSFSITALPTWLSSPQFADVASRVDFVAPQFYEGRVGRTVDDIVPVSDPSELASGLRRLDGTGIAFYAGIPAYGHALLYDKRGRLEAVYRGLSAEDALRHPSLRYESTTPIDARGRAARESSYVGQDLVALKAIHPDSSGRGLGDTLAYLLPSLEIESGQARDVEEKAPANCRGMIVYRYPEPDETTCLSIRSIVAAIRNEAPTLEYGVEAHSRAVPYALIGGRSAQTVPRELTISILGKGNAPTETSPDALQVIVDFDRPGVEDYALGDFDRAEMGVVDDAGGFVPCGRARATALRLTRFNSQPGEVLRSGGIDLASDGPRTVRVTWRAHGMGGFHIVDGRSPEWRLADLK
ncbi:MAG TPA: DUF3142 domain-containing protein [Fimbriimonadaceae bacterium]|nr:DUF3142 domain-containing protein [Fimbriimonadaceae bacterium]